jgi:hypothetical protein
VKRDALARSQTKRDGSLGIDVPDLVDAASDESTASALQFARSLKTRVAEIGREVPMKRRSRDPNTSIPEVELWIGVEQRQEQCECEVFVFGQQGCGLSHDVCGQPCLLCAPVFARLREERLETRVLVQIPPPIERRK